ncbi:unnamed protein product [Oppiella nova]|uniref:Uncharacterized protein n=1 Tax=Oppiella nova TaxID=334625 RepID=A0A7R9LVD7_9ACAR|nr:unnamed protein product [Oppiella nova]CAG2167322.1 unnamed protein product [Oppiella nova]
MKFLDRARFLLNILWIGSAIPLICMGILELRYNHADVWAPVTAISLCFVGNEKVPDNYTYALGIINSISVGVEFLIALTTYADPGWTRFYQFIRNSLFRPFGLYTDTGGYEPIASI